MKISSDEIRHLVEGYELEDKTHWQLDPSRKAIAAESDWEQFFGRCLYRPFDVRHIYYHNAFVWNRRFDTMKHMMYKESPSPALITIRQVAEEFFSHVLVSQHPIDNRVTFSSRGLGYLFPLYLYQEGGIWR